MRSRREGTRTEKREHVELDPVLAVLSEVLVIVVLVLVLVLVFVLLLLVAFFMCDDALLHQRQNGQHQKRTHVHAGAQLHCIVETCKLVNVK